MILKYNKLTTKLNLYHHNNILHSTIYFVLKVGLSEQINNDFKATKDYVDNDWMLSSLFFCGIYTVSEVLNKLG